VLQEALSYAVVVVFVLLGVAAFLDWVRHRDAAHAYLALAFGSLGFVALLSRLELLAPGGGAVLTIVTVLVFLESGYALLLLRSEFMPLSRSAHRVIVALLVAAALFFVGATVSSRSSGSGWRRETARPSSGCGCGR
jgi:hypothetical protein